jgi:hypothetical protein
MNQDREKLSGREFASMEVLAADLLWRGRMLA